MNLREIEMMGQIQRRDARIAELELEITALKGDSRLCGEKMSEQDKRCKCCGYMTYQREHMGCIRAATAQPDGEAVAWQVRNGVVTHGFYKSQSDAEEVARDMQKSHDLSGSFASFNVRPLYTEPPTPRAQLMRVAVPGIRPNW